ncbi:hypothetical protein AFLA_002394 [Aspergillus flavus NRRL3357]|nr:hypothetical protein AFLA_002394 [Aspergillus flavus NRRL3357]
MLGLVLQIIRSPVIFCSPLSIRANQIKYHIQRTYRLGDNYQYHMSDGSRGTTRPEISNTLEDIGHYE